MLVRPRTYHALSEINVTNLVDVVLVLLMIFMITAPLLQSGIDVQLPRTSTVSDELSEGVVVTITEEGGIFVNDVYRPAGEWQEELQRAINKKPNQKGYLRADGGVSYRIVVDVLSAMRQMGLSDVGLVTNPTEEKDDRAKQTGDGWG